MKRLLYLFAALIPLIALIYFFAHPRLGTGGTPGRLNAAKEKRWKADQRIRLGTPEFRAVVRANLAIHGKELTKEQMAALEQLLDLWSKAYSTNSFERYMEFRQPSHIEVAGSSLAFEANWLKTYRGESIDELTPKELLRKVYTFDTTFILTYVARRSLQVSVRSLQDLKSPFLSRCFDYYAETYVELGGNSPCKYDLDPKALLMRDKSILCVRVAGAFFTSVVKDHPIPVLIFFYWVPSEGVWRPLKMMYGASLTENKVQKRCSLYF